MVRYYKKNSSYLNTIIRQRWMIIFIILIFGLVNVNAASNAKCCYSVKSALKTAPNMYELNVTASHVDSRKSNNLFVTAITFPEGYSVIGTPFSPFSRVECSQTPGTGASPQFECESRDKATFFAAFEFSIQTPATFNSTLTATSVFIFGDKCQNVAFCTDLAEKKEAEGSDKISLGPLGTWPKYAVIIGGVILGLSLLGACYLVYRRNKTSDRYRDTSITPSTGNYNDKRTVFAPNSLLRSDDNDLPPPSIEPPKNTLIQFGSAAARSPKRSKSVQNRDLPNQHPSTKKKKDRKDKKDHQKIDICDNVKSDGKIGEESHTLIQIPDNVLEKPSSSHNKAWRNHDNNVLSTNRISIHQTSDKSKTISNHGNEWGKDSGDNEFYSSVKRSNTKSGNGGESRRDTRSSNNPNGASYRNSNSRGVEEDREGRRVDVSSSSKKHRSSTTDLHKGPSTRTRQTDRGDPREERRQLKESTSNSDLTKKNRGSSTDIRRSKTFSPSQHQSNKDTGKNHHKSSLIKSKSNSKTKTRDLISHADTESTTSSSDVPLGDRLPLAMLTNASRTATKLPPSGQSNSWRLDDVEDDDDTTPLGRISSGGVGKTDSFGATSTSSHTRLLSVDKSSSERSSNQFLNYDMYDSILDEVLATDYQNSERGSGYKSSEDNYPVGKRINEREKSEISDEEVPIGQLRRDR